MWIWSLAILLASRSYAQARLGHIDREKERRRGPYNVAKHDAITRRAKSTTTRRLIVCTPWHIVHQEAFETTAHEILLVVLLLRNHKQVREPGDDADSWQSQVDRKSYIAHSRDLSRRPTFTFIVCSHKSPLVLDTKANKSYCWQMRIIIEQSKVKRRQRYAKNQAKRTKK